MKIEQIEISNYRGLTIKIEYFDKVAIIIGQNDSGKTNICSAIRKVLDFTYRKRPFLVSDSTSGNMEPIEITIKLVLNSLTIEQSAIIRDFIHQKNDQKYIFVKLYSEFNPDTLQYEDMLFMGDPDKDFIEVKPEHQTPLDKVLSIVYINPSYDNVSDKKDFFKHKEGIYIANADSKNRFSDTINESLKQLETNIQNEEVFKSIVEDINDFETFTDIFEDVNMNLAPNIKLDNIFNSLDIKYSSKDGKEISNIGDGKTKILSMLLRSKIYDEEKQKIYIVEEPENHLYVLLQRFYIESLLKMSPSQLLITTHSPYTIDFERTNQIIKIGYDNQTLKREIFYFNVDNEDFKNFGYLINIEVAEMLYYNNVLLIEGESEKYFYNLLMLKDKNFSSYIIKNKFGIFAVNGIAFKTIKKLLETLGIKVFIKTDNDIFKVPNSEKTFRYAGIERALEYVEDETRLSLQTLLNFDNLNKKRFRFEGETTKIQIIEEKMSDICNIFKNNNILISKHNKGFEKDFLDYINYDDKQQNEIITYLNKAKLRNLHEFINENNIDISITDKNRNSVLVSFYE